jgi:hypothetical protein
MTLSRLHNGTIVISEFLTDGVATWRHEHSFQGYTIQEAQEAFNEWLGKMGFEYARAEALCK